MFLHWAAEFNWALAVVQANIRAQKQIEDRRRIAMLLWIVLRKPGPDCWINEGIEASAPGQQMLKTSTGIIDWVLGLTRSNRCFLF